MSKTVTQTGTSLYLFVFAQVHEDFRIPELLSVAELYGFEIEFSDKIENKELIAGPFMVLGLASEEHASLLARRCILVK